MVKITVLGKPVPKARPRFTRKGYTYTPATTVEYEKRIQQAAKEQLKGESLFKECPLVVTLQFWLPIPKSWSKKKRALALDGELLPISRPDIDNYEKAVLDALNDVIYHDDSQVVYKASFKAYSGEPRTEIGIIKAEDINVQ